MDVGVKAPASPGCLNPRVLFASKTEKMGTPCEATSLVPIAGTTAIILLSQGVGCGWCQQVYRRMCLTVRCRFKEAAGLGGGSGSLVKPVLP